MENSTKVSKIFNIIFWVVVSIVLIADLYNVFEPKILTIFPNGKLITDGAVISEISDVTNQYFDAIYYKNYEKANMLNNFLNQKSVSSYDAINIKISKISEYTLVIKNVYQIVPNVYRVYYIEQDIFDTSTNIETNTEKMNQVILKMSPSGTFDIYYDNFI